MREGAADYRICLWKSISSTNLEFSETYVLVNAAFATVCILKDALIYYLLDGIKQIYLILDIISYTILIPVHRKNKQNALLFLFLNNFFLYILERRSTRSSYLRRVYATPNRS